MGRKRLSAASMSAFDSPCPSADRSRSARPALDRASAFNASCFEPGPAESHPSWPMTTSNASSAFARPDLCSGWPTWAQISRRRAASCTCAVHHCDHQGRQNRRNSLVMIATARFTPPASLPSLATCSYLKQVAGASSSTSWQRRNRHQGDASTGSGGASSAVREPGSAACGLPAAAFPPPSPQRRAATAIMGRVFG